HSFLLSRTARPNRVLQPRLDSTAVSQGGGAAGGRPRPDHEPPRPCDHRQPAVQREGADDASLSSRHGSVTAPRRPPSTTPGLRRLPWPKRTLTPATLPETCARSKCSSTARLL